MNEHEQGADEQSKAFIAHRHFNWLFMLDATEYKQTGIAHFMVAFGKETVFHAKFLTDDNGDGWWFIREQGGDIIQLHWDDMITKIKELIDESEPMGLVVQKHKLLTDFDTIFHIDNVLTLL